MVIHEAVKICPDLVLVDGEDLTPFRDMSKTLFSFLRSYSWNHKVERLGFDEVFMGTDDSFLSVSQVILSAGEAPRTDWPAQTSQTSSTITCFV
jgi:nucleotidyltransferase/DNA polymerase involved in DNA repair